MGLNAISPEEERFHFSMWAINKSPLIIGAALDPAKLSQASLDILENKEIIAINQDPLAKQAQLVRRDTEGEWDIWQGDLSSSRQVIGIANWRNDSQTVHLNLTTLGIASASTRDVWAARDLGTVSGSQSIDLAGHELRLWILSNIETASPLKSAAYHSAANASLTGTASVIQCPSGTCLPSGAKVAALGPGASVAFSNISSRSSGRKIVGVDFINYDYAFTTAWEWGDNTRNMTISVNGGKAKRWAVPLSGGNWMESLRLDVEVEGFVEGGGNSVVFAGFGNGTAPHLVGFEVRE